MNALRRRTEMRHLSQGIFHLPLTPPVTEVVVPAVYLRLLHCYAENISVSARLHATPRCW